MRSLDRADIGASDLAGIPWPAKPLNNHIFVENQAGYVDNAGDFAYDPDRAMSDLDAAGWVAGSDGIREKDGQRLTVNFSQLVGVPVSENEARLVQSQLAEVGIEVNIVDVPVEDFSNVLDTRDFQLIAFTWIGTPFPFRFDQIFGNCSDSNFSNSFIPGFDELVNKIGTHARRRRADRARQPGRRDAVGLRVDAAAVPAARPGGHQRQRRQLRCVRLPDPGQVGGRRLDELTLTRH